MPNRRFADIIPPDFQWMLYSNKSSMPARHRPTLAITSEMLRTTEPSGSRQDAKIKENVVSF
jgi:hypothetical protein